MSGVGAEPAACLLLLALRLLGERASDDFDEGSERFKKGDGDGGGSGGVLCESRAVVARSNCR